MSDPVKKRADFVAPAQLVATPLQTLILIVVKLPITTRILFVLTLVASMPPSWGAVPVTSLIAEPVRDEAAENHPVTVVYAATEEIDLETLETQVCIRRGSLFKVEYHPLALTSLEHAPEDRTTAIANYLVSRPSNGWLRMGKSFGIFDDVPDVEHKRQIGTVTVALGTPPESTILTAALQRMGAGDHIPSHMLTSHQFRVAFSADETISEDDVANEAIEVEGQDGNGDSIVIPAERVGAEVAGGGEQVIVTYRIVRPGEDWGYSRLKVRWKSVDDVTIDRGVLGVIQVPSLQVTVYDASGTQALGVSVPPQRIADPELQKFAFQIMYRPTEHGIDVSSLGDDDLVAGSPSLFFPQASNINVGFRSYVIDADGVVVATYEIDRPEGGWKESSSQDTLGIILRNEAVRFEDGRPIKGATLGSIYLDLDPGAAAAHQLGFEGWAEKLAEVLGEGNDMDPDVDDDGLENTLEYALGRDPLKEEANNPLRPHVMLEDGRQHLELQFSWRADFFGFAAELQASIDGRVWEQANEHFDVVERVPLEEPDLERVTVRSQYAEYS